MEEVPWRQAVAEIAPGEPAYQALLADIGHDVVYSLPWDEIQTVLEVGVGLGALTARLVERAALVIAVEPRPAFALFQHRRAAQDGISNWHPVIAAPRRLPFPAETFDLVALNQVLETIAEDEAGEPEQLQSEVLREALRLLKPGGYLYFGARTRFALNAWRGQPDRSGLAFTSLMPRFLADWYCRRAACQRCGEARHNTAYRSHTYTPRHYESMVRAAGFGSVQVFGTADTCQAQRLVYPLDNATARRVTRAIADPPLTRKGRLLRRLADAESWYDVLENEIVVLARKAPKAGRLAWAGLPHEGPITQFSTHDKVFALCFEKGVPTSVFIGAKSGYASHCLEREYQFLQDASQRHGEAVATWPLRWPRPLGRIVHHGQAFFHYEFAHGMPLKQPLTPAYLDEGRFLELLTQVMDRYIDLCAQITAGLPESPTPAAWEDFLDRLGLVSLEDEAMTRHRAEACALLRSRHDLARVVHGDLSLSNAVVLPNGSMVLVDWENVSTVGCVALDLVRLLYDAWDDSAHLRPAARNRIMARATQATRDALARLGLQGRDFALVEALYVAHQIELGALRDVPPGVVLNRYRQRQEALQRA